MKTERILWAIIIGCIVLIAVLGIVGCSSSKHVTLKTDESDSLHAAELDSLKRVQELQRLHYEQMLKEAQYSGIWFDNPCPTGTFYKTIPNTVKIFPDGTIEGTGRIGAVNTSKTKEIKTIIDYKRLYDSLLQVKQKVVDRVVTKTVEKEKIVKRRMLWWLYVLCFAGGCVVWARFGERVKSFFNK
jgi:hypothetical protein